MDAVNNYTRIIYGVPFSADTGHRVVRLAFLQFSFVTYRDSRGELYTGTKSVSIRTGNILRQHSTLLESFPCEIQISLVNQTCVFHTVFLQSLIESTSPSGSLLVYVYQCKGAYVLKGTFLTCVFSCRTSIRDGLVGTGRG